jgi:hypothetical protein
LAEKKTLQEKRQRLQALINSFEKKLSVLTIMHNIGSGDLVRVKVSRDESEEEEELLDDEEEVKHTPENITLLLPSNLTAKCQKQPGLSDLSKQEAQLRLGQLNDALEQLKVALGGKSLIMRKKVCLLT